ncbi:hypothetical protein KBB89_04030 [Candidatus Gracilibacteria bacterium]|nr:hypothetical protein [Candidatus Gracilibacteria bacterium]
MKKFLALALLAPFFFSFAQTNEAERTFNVADCSFPFVLRGDADVRNETTRDYIVSPEDSALDIEKRVTYTLQKGTRTIETVVRDRYSIYFEETGDFILTARVQYGESCDVAFTKQIRVFPFAIAYIGDTEKMKIPVSGDSTSNSFVSDALRDRDILFSGLTPPPSQGSISFQEFDDFIIKNIGMIEDSDVVIINSVNFLSLFDSLGKIVKNADIKSLSSKRIFVVSDINESFLAKILGQSIGRLGITEVSLVEPSGLFELLLQITPENLSFGQSVSYSTDTSSYSLSRFLEYLLYFGFGYSFLGFLLKVAIVLLVLNFLKQAIGVHIFAVYNPLFLALCFAVFGIGLTSIFLFIAFLSTRVINLISSHIPLLYNTRRSLLITLYILLSLIFLGLDIILGWQLVDYVIFSNIFTIFPFLFLIMVADKIFHEDINIWSRAGFVSFIQFIIISLVTYLILSSTNLQQFLISYPDSLFFILILNFMIGRYTGLQLFEYIRFTPLIKKLQEEE